jgi:succinate dehydrogenase / fumarate reductase flavoprotein subunit
MSEGRKTVKPDYEIQESDVLVIGGGLAGVSAAIRAKDFVDRVTLVEKAKIGRSGSSIYCHAYGAPVPDDAFEQRMKEMVRQSGHLGDQSWFEIYLREIGERQRDMERWGVLFEKDEHGNLKRDEIRGMGRKFMALAYGKQVIESTVDYARRKGVRVVERVAVTDLLTSDGNYPTEGYVVGAVGIDARSGQFIVFKSKAVVITTGMISGKLHSNWIDNVTGDGHAMAFRAGAEIGGMEFAPCTFGVWNRKFTTGGQGQFQHGGTKLVNRLGEEFLYKYEGASREFVGFEGREPWGELVRAIAVEILEGRGPVHFDCRAWSEEKIDKLRKVQPFTMMSFDEQGVNLKKDLVEGSPLPGFYGNICQSGMRVSTLGESTIRGLYAAGVTAMYGSHTIPQGMCVVGGYRAGESAAKWSRDAEFADDLSDQAGRLREGIFSSLKRKKGISPDEIYNAVNKAVTPWGASIFKHEKRIRAVLSEIRRIAREELPRMKANDIHELMKATEAKNFVLLMELYNIAALERKESRMTHYREEYPYADDRDWLKWVILKNDGKRVPQIKIEPVPLGFYAILPEGGLTRKPVPVQYKMGKM